MPSSLDFEEKKAFDASPTESAQQNRPLTQETQDVETQGDEHHDVADIATVASTIESQFSPPPDGGLHAWLKVFGGFLIYINIWFVD